MLKGRHHYLCLAKLDGGTAEEPDGLFDVGDRAAAARKWLGEAGRLGKQIQRLREWADGDRAPATATSSTRASTTPPGGWSRCRPASASARCAARSATECFAEASRARAREVDVVVTNHSLLAFDMLAGRHIIPPHRLLVVDEAHELADRVSSASQAELTPDLVDRAARRARSLVDAEVHERAGRRPATRSRSGSPRPPRAG